MAMPVRSRPRRRARWLGMTHAREMSAVAKLVPLARQIFHDYYNEFGRQRKAHHGAIRFIDASE